MTDVQRVTAAHRTATPTLTTAPARVAASPALAALPAPPRVENTDPRYKALRNFAISMSIFNILGYTVLGFEQPWAWPFLALLTGYSAEFLFESVAAWAQRRRPAYSGHGMWGLYTFLLPTHITSLATNMLLYANSKFWPIAFAVTVAIGQKYVLQAPIKGRIRHFMNPSNFGITITLLAFAWVNVAPPYHFTENVPNTIRIGIPLIIATAGTVLNAVLTKKVGLIMGWTGAFVIQALLRWAIWDVAIWAALGPMTGVAFILFTNYMITDPGTTPTPFRNQFMFGSLVGVAYGILMVFNIVYTLFFAVTIVCLARGAYWWLKWLLDRRRPVPAGIPAAA